MSAYSLNLQQFLQNAVQAHQIDAALAQLIETLAAQCATLSNIVQQGALGGVLGEAGHGTQQLNVQGEAQKKLDVIANDTLINAFKNHPLIAGMASEELEHPINGNSETGAYLLLFDPLDGSSNIDVNISVGTIFSILPTASAHNPFLQAGTQQLVAGYALYGPQTTLVFTFGHGTHGFTLDPHTQHFVLTAPSMRIPEHTSEFAINMSNQRHWEMPVQTYIAELLAGRTGVRQRDFNMRWVASMVAEVHRILTRGGVFMYPRDAREPNKPGKLRLMYEANPMSWLIEQAGGASSNGHLRILDIQPEQLHQRVAVMLGCREEIERLEHLHRSTT